MAISDTLYEARQQIQDYLDNNIFNYEEVRDDVEWLLKRMEELQRCLDLPPGAPKPDFVKRFGGK